MYFFRFIHTTGKSTLDSFSTHQHHINFFHIHEEIKHINTLTKPWSMHMNNRKENKPTTNNLIWTNVRSLRLGGNN